MKKDSELYSPSEIAFTKKYLADLISDKKYATYSEFQNNDVNGATVVENMSHFERKVLIERIEK